MPLHYTLCPLLTIRLLAFLEYLLRTYRLTVISNNSNNKFYVPHKSSSAVIKAVAR